MADFDAWLSTGATAGLWICLGWLLVGFALALLAEVPGAFGRVCGRLAGRVSPRIVQQLARCVTGLVLAAASVAGASTAASATVASQAPRWPSPAQSGTAVLSGLPDLDRPTSVAGSSVGTGAPRPTRMSRLPTAMQPSPVTSPRLPTAPAQPPATGQPGQPGPGQPESGNRAGSEGRSPDEPPSRDRAVVVIPGDTLWDIAARELGGEPSNREIAERWPRWYASNRGVIGADPDLILPGQRLSPPD